MHFHVQIHNGFNYLIYMIYLNNILLQRHIARSALLKQWCKTSRFLRYIFGLIFLPWSTSYNSEIFELKVPVCLIYKISFYLSSQFSLIYLFLFAPRTRFCCHFSTTFQFFLAFSIWGLICIAVVFHYITYWYTKGLKCRRN